MVRGCLVALKMTHSIQIQKTELAINEWFNTCDIDNISPFICVEYVVNKFCNYIENCGYILDIPKQTILQDMCSATCTMYYYQKWRQNRFIVGAPKRKFSIPKQWNNALELQWKDYVHSRIVNYEFWEQFWKEIQSSYMELTFTKDNWRDVMQYLLPFYIRREIDILLDEEIVCQEENGNFVTWDDHEVEEDVDADEVSKKKKGK